mgnify:CR=1 FL=1
MEMIQKEKVKLTAKVVSQEALTDDICSMWIQADAIAKAAKPGQFISVCFRVPSAFVRWIRSRADCASYTAWWVPEPESSLHTRQEMISRSWAR